MARIVIAVDKRGRKWKVTEQEAKERGLTVQGKTATAETKTKTQSNPTRKTTARKPSKKK